MSSRGSEQDPGLPDPKAVAFRRFANAAYCAESFDIVERYATDVEATKRAFLDAIGAQPPRGRICELGFGTGWLLKELQSALPSSSLWGLEISLPMTAHAKRTLGSEGQFAIIAGDIENLPFVDAVFDVALVDWTLYFMRDIDLALKEIKRVLKKGGKVIAATWAKDHMHEFEEASAGAIRAVFGDSRHHDVVARFDVDSAPDLIKRHFDRVTTSELRGWLEPPDVATLVRFWQVQHAPGFPDALIPVRDQFRRLVAERFAREGHFRISRHGDLFVGYKP